MRFTMTLKTVCIHAFRSYEIQNLTIGTLKQPTKEASINKALTIRGIQCYRSYGNFNFKKMTTTSGAYCFPILLKKKMLILFQV